MRDMLRTFLKRLRSSPPQYRSRNSSFFSGSRHPVIKSGKSRSFLRNFSISADPVRSTLAGSRLGVASASFGLALGFGIASSTAFANSEDEPSKSIDNSKDQEEMRENPVGEGLRQGLAAVLAGSGEKEERSLHKSSILDSPKAKSVDPTSFRLSVAKSLGSKKFKIFVGYDPREDIAFEVCRHSILKHSSIPVEIIPIVQSDLRTRNLYWRKRGNTESTEFSFTRFLTPFLAEFEGWALFIDCDFLYTRDVKELVELIDEKYAVMCVQHDYTPKETTKMDGIVQTTYPRKNWSSMVLYNCGHPKNRVLTPEVVNSQTGAYLHRFMWLDDSEIGSIPFVWNFLVGHNNVVSGDPKTYPRAIHYTLGGPWFEAWKDCEFADLWLKEKEEYETSKTSNFVGSLAQGTQVSDV